MPYWHSIKLRTYKYSEVLNAKYFSHGAFRRKYVFDMYEEYEAEKEAWQKQPSNEEKKEIKRAEIS